MHGEAQAQDFSGVGTPAPQAHPSAPLGPRRLLFGCRTWRARFLALFFGWCAGFALEGPKRKQQGPLSGAPEDPPPGPEGFGFFGGSGLSSGLGGAWAHGRSSARSDALR